MRRRLPRLIGAVLAVLAVTLAWVGPAAPARADSASDLVGLVNNLRSGRGLGPLAFDPTLTQVAQHWSSQMAAAGKLSHNPGLTSAVPAGWTLIGENVGEGGNLTVIFQALVADPAHLANMLDPAYNRTGVGIVVGRNGTLWVTQDFEALAGTVVPTPTTPAPAPAPAPAPVTVTTRPVARAPVITPTVQSTTPVTTTPATSVAPSTTLAPPSTTTTTVTVPPDTSPRPGVPSIESKAIAAVGAHTGDGRGPGGWVLAGAVFLLAGLAIALGATRRILRLP